MKILKLANHPFMVKMHYIFQTKDRIFFIMEFIKGGELYQRLVKVRRFTEEEAKFYAATLIIAIGFLHEKKIIYRDLKPENVLINADGYLKLADFGLAKDMTDKTFASTFCGTPEYFAPELLKEAGHNHAVDWWAIGVLIYEMIIGFPPFYNKSQKKMFNLICNYPPKFPDPARHKVSMSAEA